MASDRDVFDLTEREDADEKAAREKREGDRAQREIDDLRWLMSTPRGRRIMWRILSHAGIYRTSFNDNAHAMAYREGQRGEGLYWLNEVDSHAPDTMGIMHDEQREAPDNG